MNETVLALILPRSDSTRVDDSYPYINKVTA